MGSYIRVNHDVDRERKFFPYFFSSSFVRYDLAIPDPHGFVQVVVGSDI